jgi:DNA-binding winged helix-turn-helix (wHTH) protein
MGAKSFTLLEYLIENRDRVVAKDELREKIWTGLRHPNVVEQTVRQVRLALLPGQNHIAYIQTVPGSGYRFVAPSGVREYEPVPTVESSSIKGDNVVLTDELEADHAKLFTPERLKEKDRPRNLPSFVYLAGLLLGFFVLLLFCYATAPGSPEACEVDVNTLIAKDGQGRVVWRREIVPHLNRGWYQSRPPLCRFVDLNGDGINDVVFASIPEDSDVASGTLYGYLSHTAILRRFHVQPSTVYTFTPGVPLVVGPNSDRTSSRQYDPYLPPYFIQNVFAEQVNGLFERLVVTSTMNEAPNQIAVLNSKLQKVSEYWHTGQLSFGQFATYEGKERLFLGGVNNGYHSATLVTFDPKKISGTTDLSVNLPYRAPLFTVLAVGSPGHLSPLKAGTETCRVIFERSDVAKVKPYAQPYNRVVALKVADNDIVVIIAQSEKQDAAETTTYQLDRHLNLLDAYGNTGFRQRHVQLQQEGLLDHPYSNQELKSLVHILPGCEFVVNK